MEDLPASNNDNIAATKAVTIGTSSAQQQQQQQQQLLLINFPESILAIIFHYLSVGDARYLLSTCHDLWQRRKPIESLRYWIHCAGPSEVTFLYSFPVLVNFCRVQTLDLGRWASDRLLRVLGGDDTATAYDGDATGGESSYSCSKNHNSHVPLPYLHEISMVHSLDITDRGLFFFVGCADRAEKAAVTRQRQKHLKLIDITYCHKTSYAMALELRNVLNSNDYDHEDNIGNKQKQQQVIIRRQPKWMDGHYETSFENDGIHTYWADGSFSFERGSCGFVLRVFPWEEENGGGNTNATSDYGHVGDYLRYTNEDQHHFQALDVTMPCPGVSLLLLDEEDGMNKDGDDNLNGGSKSVLVAQYVRGLRPPMRHYPKMDTNLIPAFGESIYLDKQENILSNTDNTNIQQQYIMITHMRIYPLGEGEMMPPQHVLEQNENYLKRSSSRFHSRNY